MTTNYHNTTSESGAELDDHISKASGQDKILSEWFKKNPDKEVTAEDLWINLFDTSSVPITSIRRSLNTIRKPKWDVVELVLDKDGNPLKKKGAEFGRKIFVYRLKRVGEEKQLELNL